MKTEDELKKEILFETILKDWKVFCQGIKVLQFTAFQTAKDKGFYDDIDAINVWWPAAKIALMHSELSEALEAIRKPRQSEKLPQYTALATEMADTVIRILDFCEAMNISLGEVILIKMAYNAGREFKHGGKTI